MTHFLTTPKFDLLLYIGEKCAKNPYFYHFFWKKEVKLEKNQKKAVVGINCGPWPIFPNITHLTHFYIWGVKCSGHIFFILFLGKTGQITRYLWKKNYGYQLGHMTHFLTNPKIWPTFIYLYHQFFKSSCACSNSWPTKKNLRASTRTHDPFSDNSKIWPTFIYRGEVPADTFAKLPVCALINDPKKLFPKKVYVTIPQWFETFPNMSDLRSGRNRAKCGLVLNNQLPVHTLINDPQKNWYRHQLQPMTHFFTNHKFDLLSYIYIINFLNLPVHALIHDLQKKNLWASTRTHDPFSDNSKIWPTFIYRGEVPADTFAKLPVCALINDPKKLFQKKVYVTIPQWFETFPNMSDLRSGRNRAKCGLVLNDPIDWFKLRLNQPKNRSGRKHQCL